MADINIKVGLQGAAEVKAQMGYIETAAKSFADKLNNKLVSTFSAVAVGAMAFDKLLESVNKNISAAKQITSLSTKFHLDPKAVHSMMIAANNAGVAIRTLLQGMKQLTKYADGASGKSGNKDMLKQLFGFDSNGKEIADLELRIQEISKAPAKFLPEVAMALARINNEQDKTKMGTALLGRQYQQLIPLLDQLAESEEARKNFLENGNAMSAEQIEQAKKLGAATSDLQNAWDKFSASLFPVLTMLTNGLTLLSSWVSQIKLIGHAWRNEITQENARVNQKIVTYESALRTRASSGHLTSQEIADLQKAREGGMTQEEWINKRVRDYGRTQWNEAESKNNTNSGWRTAAGVGMVLGAVALGVMTGGVGLGVLALGGYGAYTASEGIEGLTGGAEEVKKARKEQEEAYDKEIKEREKKFGEKKYVTKDQKIKEAKERYEDKIREIQKKRIEYGKKIYIQNYLSKHGVTPNINWDAPNNGRNIDDNSDTDDSRAIAAANAYGQGLIPVEGFENGNPEQEAQETLNAEMVSATDGFEVDTTTPIGQAYNWLVQKGAAASEKEISDQMIALGLQEKDAIAGLRSFFTGEDWHYDREKNQYVRGKKPKPLPTIQDLNLDWKAEDKKREAAREKARKALTRSDRQIALAEMRANETTTPEEEAVAAGKMGIKNAKEDIEEADIKFYDTKNIEIPIGSSKEEVEEIVKKHKNLTEQKEEADKDLEAQKKALEAEMEKQKKLTAKRDAYTPAQRAELDRNPTDEYTQLGKDILESNKNVEEAKTKVTNATTALTNAENKETEALQAQKKARIDLANAIREHAKAVEQLWLKEIQDRKQERDDEIEWENYITDVKYRNMKKLGYTQSQIAEEQFLDAKEMFEEKQNDELRAMDEVREKAEARWEEEEKRKGGYGLSEREIERRLNEPKKYLTQAEQAQLREAKKGTEKAYMGVDKALENWENIKPDRVVSDLGKVGGGKAWAMEGSGPTELLKESNKHLRQLVHNTDPNKSDPKVGGKNNAWGDRSVWGVNTWGGKRVKR